MRNLLPIIILVSLTGGPAKTEPPPVCESDHPPVVCLCPPGTYVCTSRDEAIKTNALRTTETKCQGDLSACRALVEKSDRLSTGAIVGITIGATVTATAIAFAVGAVVGAHW